VIAPLHRVGPQLLVIDVPQGGVEGEDDVLVGGDLAAGLTALVDTDERARLADYAAEML